MEKSIPLKEIVGFLPYSLKVIHTEFEPEGAFTQEAEIVTISTECICFEAKWSASDYYFNEPDCEIKPIVRPLSDLTKEITHNGETFVPIDVLDCEAIEFGHGVLGLKIYQSKEHDFIWCIDIQNEIIQKLYEWHFDIYDWIKDGKAIDINTLKP